MFILLHTLDARFFLLKELGVKTQNPFCKYMDWSNTIDDIKKYPKLTRVINEWKKTDEVLAKKINRLTTKQIDKETNMNFPGEKRL
jgi:hypothetical protein